MRTIRRTLGGLARKMGLLAPHAVVNGKEEAASYYDRMYSGTEVYQVPYEKSHYYFLWSVIADRIRSAKLKRILEIGCGPGQLASYLFDQGIERYTGLDFSATAIEMAKKNTPNGTFVVGDARDGAIHAQVDHEAVICTEVLEHIHDDLLVLSHFTPGKRCFCTVPNFPYESHVRHFRNADEVIARYGAFFSTLDVMTFKSPADPSDRFFLLDGIRNSEAAGNP